MVDEKITDYTALTGTNLATADLFEMVDVSDISMDATGTNKKMTASELAIGIATVKPPSRSVSDTHTDQSAVNTTSETVIASQAIPTTAAVGDAFRLVAEGDLLSNSGSASTYAFKVILGATTVLTSNALSIGNSTSRRSWRVEAELLVVATNDERLCADILVGTTGTGLAFATNNNTAVGRGTAAEDLTAGKNLQVSITLGTASAAVDLVCHESWLEVIKR